VLRQRRIGSSEAEAISLLIAFAVRVRENDGGGPQSSTFEGDSPSRVTRPPACAGAGS